MTDNRSSPGSERASHAPLFYTVNQHIGWLKQYVLGMSEGNWRDMRDRAESQLEQLSREIDKEAAALRGAAQTSPDQRMTEDMTLAHNARKAAIEECARLVEGTGYRNHENTARDIRALSAVTPSPAGEWQPDQFWEYAEGLLGSEWLRDQMRDMMACKGLVLSSIAAPAETTRNLAESICDDCPPAGSIEGTRCLVCPRASSMSSTQDRTP